jgi:hypothetical protein
MFITYASISKEGEITVEREKHENFGPKVLGQKIPFTLAWEMFKRDQLFAVFAGGRQNILSEVNAAKDIPAKFAEALKTKVRMHDEYEDLDIRR